MAYERRALSEKTVLIEARERENIFMHSILEYGSRGFWSIGIINGVFCIANDMDKFCNMEEKKWTLHK